MNNDLSILGMAPRLQGRGLGRALLEPTTGARYWIMLREPQFSES